MSTRMEVKQALGPSWRNVDAAILAVDCPHCKAEAPSPCRRSDWDFCPSRCRAAIRAIPAPSRETLPHAGNPAVNPCEAIQSIPENTNPQADSGASDA